MSSTTPLPPAPRDRSGFKVAIFCALPLEAENTQSVFDICWEDEDKQYGKAPGDQNSYNTGVIGKYNVVLVHMPSIGGNSAALAAAGLRSSFRGIQLALVVGTCGVVPIHPVTGQEIVLGDVIISTAVVQYKYGRQFPGGFLKKNEVQDSLGRASPEIRSFLNMLTTRQNRERFNKKLKHLLHSEEFLSKVPDATCPGVVYDRLYETAHLHRHRSDVTCKKCLVDVGTCTRTCDELECENGKLITRHRHTLEIGQLAEDSSHAPLMHLGRFGSADIVMRSGLDRDHLSAADELTAFDMEGAGVWEQFPTVVIKAACDYADSHKNKKWQKYAAATAAGGLKVFLKEWLISEPPPDGEESSEPIWHVPFDIMPGFVGREDELRYLEQKLFEPNSPRRVSLHGLGGVGKSRVALELAFRIRSRFPKYWVLWVQGSEQSTFENNMLEIGTKLGITGIKDEKADVKTLVKQQLSNSKHQWVLILDNADDLALWGRRSNSNSTQASLVEYLPRTTTGSILITTRSAQIANDLAETEVVKLPTLPPEEAIKMFIKRLQNTDLVADREALSLLLEQLAYLPLALVQAASYINITERPIQTYINLMAQSENHVLELLSQDFGDLSRYYNAINPVATTWLISFNHIKANHPFAAILLSRMACFHEKGIPLLLLSNDDSKCDDVAVINAVAVLTGYSFITRQTAISGSSIFHNETYDMHRLVRLAARNWLKLEGTFSDYIRSSTLRLVQLFPKQDYQYKSIWAMYIPHAQCLCEEVDGHDLPERYELLEKMGFCFVVDGNYDKAVKAHTVVVNWRENLGLLDRRLFDAYNNLGTALSWKGELPKAEKYLQQALSWQREYLGKDDDTTLSSMTELAQVLSDQGNYSKAEQMHRQVLGVRKRISGPEHHSTRLSMNNLALVLSHQRKYSEAERMHREELRLTERILGIEDPDTLTSMSNLASVLSDQGRNSAAEHMYRQVLEVRERILGAEHPSTLTGLHNLAMVLSHQDKGIEAELMHRQVLGAQKRVLGPEHPSTLISMNNLALMIGHQGKHSDAEQMHRQVLRARGRVLGVEHPDTISSMSNLAIVLGDQGKYIEAEPILRQVLRMRGRVLGVEHLDTLNGMNSLGLVLSHQGKYSEAESMHRQALGVMERVLGIEHPDTLNSIINLALVLSHQGKYDEAERRQVQAVKFLVITFGPQHPKTKVFSAALIEIWRGQGRKMSEIERMLVDDILQNASRSQPSEQ